jgi:tRNA U34 5-methylaminomethyl-2-thiouridine-forming methyltransferase MnmC
LPVVLFENIFGKRSKSMETQLVVTEDGSHSIYLPELDEHYHSTHGAIQESRHVFINAGLRSVCLGISKVEVLEIGFGTGLNAFLTYLESHTFPAHINYTTLEPFPVSRDIIRQLNYPELLEAENEKAVFKKMHQLPFGQAESFNEKFSLLKMHSRVQDAELLQKYHLVYFDAFAPRVQPEMWTEDIFSSLHECLVPGGALVTYCAKGEVKRTLRNIGFEVETLPGPPGKREMIRAAR